MTASPVNHLPLVLIIPGSQRGQQYDHANPRHYSEKWSTNHNQRRVGTKSRSSLGSDVSHRSYTGSGSLCSGRWAVFRVDLSVNINQMRTNRSGGQNADVKQKSMNTFHSWLGRIGGLIVMKGVRLWGPPLRGSGAIMAIEILGGLQFFTLIPAFTDICGTNISASQQETFVRPHTFTQMDTLVRTQDFLQRSVL